ncbi:lipoprotein [Staphylococcus aureus]|nr:lipoprotein [Staphylococcus aureus]
MTRLFSLLLASTMILVACGKASNENKEMEDEKKKKSKKKLRKIMISQRTKRRIKI